jgi:phospholipid/cholesterol/gamma-HCH transport system substrate-binding protein
MPGPASQRAAQFRVGLLVIVSLAVLGVAIFLIGEQNRLFVRKNRYFFKAASVTGLNERNPVLLNGVNVGVVENITLPEDVRRQLLTIRISIDRQYEKRIRQDSTARIKTLGLLGDKYVEVTSGSPGAPVIAPEGTIPTAPDTDVDKLIASGGDVVDNMVRISYSLAHILERVDRGQGLVGQLTSERSSQLTVHIDETLASAQHVMDQIENGRGPLGRLVSDEALGARLASAVERLDSLVSQADRGDNVMATLLRSPETRAELDETLADAKRAAASLRKWTSEVESSDSAVNMLLTDNAAGQRLHRDLESLVRDLSSVAAKLDRGEGSVSKLINDPKIYDAVNDVIVGVDKSPMLRWLVRHNQKKGIKTRYEAAGGPQPVPEVPASEVAPTPSPTPPASPGASAPAAETIPAPDAAPSAAPSPTPGPGG